MSTPPHSVLVTQNNVIRLCGEFLVAWFTSLSLQYSIMLSIVSPIPCAVVNLAYENMSSSMNKSPICEGKRDGFEEWHSRWKVFGQDSVFD